jgi:hypothetical protein
LLRRTKENICRSEKNARSFDESEEKRSQVEGYATMSVASELSIVTTILVFGFLAAFVLGVL